ncbi:hypothetical protein [Micropruina sp.]|uniref:hypothetical protein n=1 Tax=Micropruina sp. TaxID=2737536 RepID=UPI0039E45BE4
MESVACRRHFARFAQEPVRPPDRESDTSQRENQMTAEWAPFEYLDYSDYPRILVVAFDNSLYLLDAPFDEEADEYARDYTIKILNEAPGSGSWADLGLGLPVIGSLAVVPELFDRTRRREIRVDLIRSAIMEG